MAPTIAAPQFSETGTVARELRVSESIVRVWIRQGRVTPIRTVGGRYLFTPEQIETLRARRNPRQAPQIAA